MIEDLGLRCLHALPSVHHFLFLLYSVRLLSYFNSDIHLLLKESFHCNIKNHQRP